MNNKERISHEEGDSDAWVCICKNVPADDGFYPCNERGEEVEPVEGWDGLYVCASCGRIINCDTLEVVGRCALEQPDTMSFPVLGNLYSTPGAQKALEESGETIQSFLSRYLRGDWGDCNAEDSKSNDEALKNNGRILAVYHTKKAEKLWVITEWYRSATTFL